MAKVLGPILIGALAFGLPVLVTTSAQAGIEACGDIHVEANAQCEVVAEGGCVAHCSELSMEAACDAELHGGCRVDGQCNLTAEASCTGECQGTCESECAVDPPSFDCFGSCEADCSANCGGDCQANCEAQAQAGEASADCQAECEASCSATCKGECDISCEVDPNAEVDCTGKCEGKCEGQCTAEVNMGCQIECQPLTGRVECEASLQGGCEVQCTQPGGVLECDGEYIDHGGNAQECIDSLRALLNIEVSGSASAGCDGGTCEAEAEGEASASCAATPHSNGSNLPVFGLLAAIGALAAARRRRQ